MADVFLSYMSDDRATAARISSALEAAGLSVWWDRHIKVGADFAAEIDHQIKTAKAVIVLWSSRSVDSTWVRDEASYARDEHKLIPVRLDAAQPPLGFRQLQSLDFAGSMNSGHVVEELVAAVRQFVGGGRREFRGDVDVGFESVPHSSAKQAATFCACHHRGRCRRSRGDRGVD